MYNKPMTDAELNSYVIALRNDAGGYFPAAKSWQRIDVGDIETYVGDRLYVIAIAKETPSETDIDEVAVAIQTQVIKYLQSEGFIDAEFLYIGLQEFRL